MRTSVFLIIAIGMTTSFTTLADSVEERPLVVAQTSNAIDASSNKRVTDTDIRKLEISDEGGSLSVGDAGSSDVRASGVGSSAGTIRGSSSTDNSLSINSSAPSKNHAGSYDWRYSTGYSDGGPSGGSLSRNARY